MKIKTGEIATPSIVASIRKILNLYDSDHTT